MEAVFCTSIIGAMSGQVDYILTVYRVDVEVRVLRRNGPDVPQWSIRAAGKCYENLRLDRGTSSFTHQLKLDRRSPIVHLPRL